MIRPLPKKTDRLSKRAGTRAARLKHRRRLQKGVESLESRQLLAVVTGTVFEDLNEDRIQNINEPGLADVRVYVDANDNSQFDLDELSVSTDQSGQYTFDSLGVGSPVLRIEAPTGTIQTSPTMFFGIGFAEGDVDLTQPVKLIGLDDDGTVRQISTYDDSGIRDTARTSSGMFFAIGGIEFRSVYTVDENTGESTLLATNDGLFLAPGLAYDERTDTLFALAATTVARNDYALYVVDQQSGELSGPRSESLNVPVASDITFDSVNNRIVGYDNDQKRFFEIRLDGSARLLGIATPPVNSFVLEFDGNSFVIFDQPASDEPTSRTFLADPDRGTLTPGLTPSTPLLLDSLTQADRGDIASRITIESELDSFAIHFGVVKLPAPVDAQDYPPVINELLVDPRFGDRDTDQYVELRGAPGGQLGDNTYLVIVDEDNGSQGEIHGIFDLSNQEFGANGFLVLLQENSPYLPHPHSRVLQSTSTGFGGLPGDIYNDRDTITDRLDFIFGGNAFMLIQTDQPPQLGDDIDPNDDGIADAGGLISGWNVLDSISLHAGVSLADQAYSQILIAETFLDEDPNTRTVPAGGSVLVSEGFGYAARIGDSIGSDVEDWLSGRPRERTGQGADVDQYEVQGNFNEKPEPTAFHSRDLDHIGDSNFVGGVRGRITFGPALSDARKFPGGNSAQIRKIASDLNRQSNYFLPSGYKQYYLNFNS